MKSFQKKYLQHLLNLLVSVVLAMALVSCSQDGNDDDDDDNAAAEESHQEESIAAEACEHMQNGPHSEVTSSADQAEAPAVAADHKNYRVTLSGSGDNYIQFAADEATDYTFLLSLDTTPVIMDASGTNIDIEKTEHPTECDEVAAAHTVELEVGTYYLNFNQTSETMISVVAEEVGAEHADEHDHEEGHEDEHDDEENHDDDHEGEEDHEDEDGHEEEE